MQGRRFPLFTALVLIASLASGLRGAITTDLIAYYDFEESDATGLLNKAPGATGFDLGWNGTPSLSQTGFSGDPAFTAADGTSDRGTLLTGNALNIVDIEQASVLVPLGTSELGDTFTISAWHHLAPGSSNTSPRFFVFEATTNYDVSWGTGSGDTYAAYVGQDFAGSRTLARNAWHHVVQVFESDGTDTTLTVYLNGSLAFTDVNPTSTVDFAALYFGRSRNGSGDREWDGMIDEVAIWDRGITEEEQTEVYNRGLNGQAIPEPGSILLTSCLCGLLLFRRFRA